MKKPRVVLDTNVVFSSLYSSKGASFQVMNLVYEGKTKILISNTLCSEYEEILKCKCDMLGLDVDDIDIFLDALCGMAERIKLKYFWLPILKDPDDEAVIHLAYESNADYIVTHNIRHFDAVGKVGVKAITPSRFLKISRGEI
ncbi:MAG: putative toxin-antitoxin system toxin component, PIN family [Victivallales bacterium]